MEEKTTQKRFRSSSDILLACFSCVFRMDGIIKILAQTFSQNRRIRHCFSSTALASDLHLRNNRKRFASSRLNVFLGLKYRSSCLVSYSEAMVGWMDDWLIGWLVGWNS